MAKTELDASMTRSFIDLFAGCGGLSLGLLESGWDGLAAVERDNMAFETLQHNLIDGDPSRCRQFNWSLALDKRPITISEFLEELEKSLALQKELSNLDLIAGAPPCQGFSFAGRRKANDPRNELFQDYLKVVGQLRPSAVVLENVKGVTVWHAKSKPYSERIKDGLRDLGYACYGRIHLASDFGVPQRRPRFFLIAVDTQRFNWMDETLLKPHVEAAIEEGNRQLHMKYRLPMGKDTPTGHAISDLETRGKKKVVSPDDPRKIRKQLAYCEPLEEGLSPYLAAMRRKKPLQMDSMRLAKHSDDVKRKFRKLIQHAKKHDRAGVVMHESERAEILQSKKHTVVVLDRELPSHTLTTLPDDLIHYKEPRILTVREYARLQSFPDWFAFKGKYTTGGALRKQECPRYTQIGNAVAPMVGEAISIGINLLLDGLERQQRRLEAIATSEGRGKHMEAYMEASYG